MLNKSLKKLIAVASTFTMLVSAVAPMASAVTLSSPVKVGETTFATAKAIDNQDAKADGTINVSKEKLDSTVTGEKAWTVGSYLTFDMTINAATADNGGTKSNFDGLSLKFIPTDTSKTGPALTFKYTLPDATDLTKGTASIIWNGSGGGPTAIACALEIGKQYTYDMYYAASNSITLNVYDENDKLVVSQTGLPTRTAAEAGDTLAGLMTSVYARIEGQESSVTISDISVYSSIGPDDVAVTAKGIQLEKDGEEQDLELNASSNTPIFIGEDGGNVEFSGVVNEKNAPAENYTVKYDLENADEGITIEDGVVNVSALSNKTANDIQLKATLLAYPADSKNNYKTSVARIPLTFTKQATPIAKYTEVFKDSVKLLDADGKEITPTSGVYKFEKEFTPTKGDARVNVTWSCKELNASGEWIDSDIIDVDTGKYTPKAGYTKNVKLVATFTSDEDASVEEVKEFICKPSDVDTETQNDYDDLEIDERVTSDISLPTIGKYGSNITWTSSAPSIISTKGKVVRQTSNKVVTLTATIEKGNETLEKTFEVTVVKKTSGSTSGTGGTSGSSSKITGIGVVTQPSATPVPTVAPTQAPVKQEFTDLGSVEWAKEAINALSERSVVNGKTATEFAPNDDITRAEFAKILINAFGLVTPNSTVTALSDVTDSSAWYYEAIASAYNKGIITGYSDGSFGINDKVTREDMAVMVYRAAQYAKVNINVMKPETNFADANEISDYAVEAVNALQRAGVINGVSDTEFAPKATATRAQAAKMVYGLTK